MKFSQADMDKARNWLAQKCGQMRCFCCGSGRWTLAEFASINIGFDVHSTRFHYHEGIPVIAVVCENCGHVVQFAAGVMGFKPDAPPVEEVSPLPTTPAG